MPTPPAYAAVDLGAGSGRVVLGSFSGGKLFFETVHRFSAPFRSEGGRDRWPFAAICGEVRTGLAAAGARARAAGYTLRSAGVDSWGVDYGWLDAEDRLLEDPVCYRDARTRGALEQLLAKAPREFLYQRTGIQFLPINTLVQLFAESASGARPAGAARLLMMADLVHHDLCGSTSGEVTNASTTQLWNPTLRAWDPQLCELAGVAVEAMPRLAEPGARLGIIGADASAQLGLRRIPIICPGTHDTASAVAAVPMETGTAYISSGTWSLAGVELLAPVLTPEAMDANCTNEAGVGGVTRFLKNIMGLWILEGVRASAANAGEPLEYQRLESTAFRRTPGASWIDPDDLRFLHPNDMADEVRAALRESGQPVPADYLALAQCVLQSLAMRYAQTVDTIERVTNYRITDVRIVGGGARNDYLSQAAADASRRPVRSGPIEATALGNLMVQAIADEEISGLAAGRKLIAKTTPMRLFEPAPGDEWIAARAAFEAATRR